METDNEPIREHSFIRDDHHEHEQPPHEHMLYREPPPQYIQQQPTRDIFAEIDKTTYIIIFVAFILGFFMGKTMNPVIIRAMGQ